MSTIASGHLRTPHGDWFREGDASGAATQVTREFQAIAELSVIYASSPVNGRREFNDTHREARSLGLIQIRRSMRYTKITIVFATCLGIGIVSGGATASAKTQGAAAAACYNGAPDQNQGIFSDFTGELLGVVPIQCVEPVFGRSRTDAIPQRSCSARSSMVRRSPGPRSTYREYASTHAIMGRLSPLRPA